MALKNWELGNIRTFSLDTEFSSNERGLHLSLPAIELTALAPYVRGK